MSADHLGTCPKCKEEDSLREYEEFYLDAETGKFIARYNASCVCGFKFEFYHTEIVKL